MFAELRVVGPRTEAHRSLKFVENVWRLGNPRSIHLLRPFIGETRVSWREKLKFEGATGEDPSRQMA